MRLSTLLISIMVFVGAFAAMGAVYVNLQTTYAPSNSTSNFTQFNDTMNDMTYSMQQLENHSIGVVKDPTKYADVSLIFLDLGGVIASSLGGFFEFVAAGSTIFGIALPNWFLTVIIGGVVLIVIFQIITIFMRSYFQW